MQAHPSAFPVGAVDQRLPRQPAIASLRPQRLHRRVRRHDDALPDRGRTEDVDDRRRAADVVRVAVRQQQPVETADAARPDRRRHDAGADVEGRLAAEAAGVDEQRGRVRQTNKRRVPLADVDAGHVEPAVRAPGRPPRPRVRDDPHGRRGCGARPGHPRAPSPAARQPVPGRRAERDEPRRRVGADGDPGRRRDARRQPGRPVQEVRAAHEHPRGGDDDPAGDIRHRRPPGVTRDDRHPRLLDDRHCRHRGEIDDRPRDGDAAEQQRRRGQQHHFGGQRRRDDRDGRPHDWRPASHAHGAIGHGDNRAGRADGEDEAGVDCRQRRRRRASGRQPPRAHRAAAPAGRAPAGRDRWSPSRPRARPTSRRRRARRRATRRQSRRRWP